MYIKLGNVEVNNTSIYDNFMIVSEIVDSQMSYYCPVLIQKVEDLDIWFGTNFESRNYLIELLESNVSLYLYKPIQDIENKEMSDYIDYYNFSIDSNLYYIESDLPIEGDLDVVYKIVDSSGENIDEDTGLNYTELIWIEGEYLDVRKLPQNYEENINSISLNNRDTLTLLDTSFKRVYPKFIYKNTSPIIYNEEIELEKLIQSFPNIDNINEGRETLSLKLMFSEDIVFENSYIILSKGGTRNLIWFTNNNTTSSIDSKYYDNLFLIDPSGDPMAEFFKTLENIGFIIEGDSIYCSEVILVDYFYEWPGFNYVPNYEITYNILSKAVEDNWLDSKVVEFVSKTIGNAGVDSYITIKTETIGSLYRLIVSRYEYEEVYEGTISEISNKINKDSKLITSILKNKNLPLPIGEWTMMRSVTEDYTTEMYMNSINKVFNKGDTVYFDYFLIPNIKKYTKPLTLSDSHYPELITFLELSKLISCQFLIQNSDSGWKYLEVDNDPINPLEGVVYLVNDSRYMAIINGVYKETFDPEIIYDNEYKFNYVGDVENRLIYFYRSMTINEKFRPGFYLYLKGLLTDNYSFQSTNINYNSPIKTPYSEEIIELEFEKYKCNYLVYNNQMYYYKKYQNGENYTTTAWMRFCLGKVMRELEKHKWEYISHRIIGDIMKNISQVLERISKNFSIIRELRISNFNVNFGENKIDLTIQTYMSDLIDMDISIDIIINYNN